MQPRTALVVASNRGDSIQEFLAAWSPYPWDHTVVVEDGPERTFALSPDVLHYSWAEIDSDPKVDGAPFSRRDSAIKTYGFVKACMDLKSDVVLVLDDDCLPDSVFPGRAFVDAHLAAIGTCPAWVPLIPGMPTRGMPYTSLGTRDGAMVNVGLWSGVADYDAPQTLHHMRHDTLNHFEPPRGNRLLHPHQYSPICGMNLAFRSWALPLLYFPKMGEGTPYRRYDDIWCGVMLQRAAAHLGWAISAGDPAIHHTRASNVLVNLEKEAPGIRANEAFWRIIDAAPLSTATTALECMATFGRYFGSGRVSQHICDDAKFVTYLAELGGHLLSWCETLKRHGWSS